MPFTGDNQRIFCLPSMSKKRNGFIDMENHVSIIKAHIYVSNKKEQFIPMLKGLHIIYKQFAESCLLLLFSAKGIRCKNYLSPA